MGFCCRHFEGRDVFVFCVSVLCLRCFSAITVTSYCVS